MLIEEIESFLEVHYKSPTVDFFFKNIEYLSTKSNYSAEVLYINPRNLFFPEVYYISIQEIELFSEARYIIPRNRIIFRRHVILIQEIRIIFQRYIFKPRNWFYFFTKERYIISENLFLFFFYRCLVTGPFLYFSKRYSALHFKQNAMFWYFTFLSFNRSGIHRISTQRTVEFSYFKCAQVHSCHIAHQLFLFK